MHLRSPLKLTAVALGVTWGLLAALHTGCASGPARQRDAATSAEAIPEAQRLLYGALLEGEQEERRQLDLREVAVVARYNPARCDCPAFEVLLRERWQRIALRWDPSAFSLSDPLTRLTRLAAQGEQRSIHPLFAFRLRLTREQQPAGNLQSYPVAVLTQSHYLGAIPLSEAIALSQEAPAELDALLRSARPAPLRRAAPKPTVESPTEEVKLPTEEVKLPTEEVKLPTEEVAPVKEEAPQEAPR